MIHRLFFLSLITLSVLSANTVTKNTDSINAIIGDESFFKTFHRSPNQYDSEDLRIKTHLRFVLEKLRQADVSLLTNQQLENRLILLSHLSDYIKAGVFPLNEYSVKSRRPNFIDSHGNICAVGYLVEKTAGRETAELLNSLFQFEYIMKMDSELLDEWLEENGLSKLEAAMIQPQYGGPITPSTFDVTSKEIGWDYGLLSVGLVSSQILLTKSAHSAKKDHSLKRRYWYSITVATLGAASIYSGVEGFKNSDQNYRRESNPEVTNIPFTYYDETNPRKKAVSLINIGTGVFTVFYNGLHAFKYNDEMKSSNLQVYSSFQYLSISPEAYPSLSLNYSF